MLPFWLKGHSLHLLFYALTLLICSGFIFECFQERCGKHVSTSPRFMLSCVFHSGGAGCFPFYSLVGVQTGRAGRVMDRARIPQQSTETLFAWLLLILTELCRRFHVNLGNVVIECFEVNYPVPPAASCQFRCDRCDLPCSCTSPDHLQHSCVNHRRNH